MTRTSNTYQKKRQLAKNIQRNSQNKRAHTANKNAKRRQNAPDQQQCTKKQCKRNQKRANQLATNTKRTHTQNGKHKKGHRTARKCKNNAPGLNTNANMSKTNTKNMTNKTKKYKTHVNNEQTHKLHYKQMTKTRATNT